MNIRDLVRDGARATIRRWVQSALTVVALAVGVCAVVTIVGISTSAAADLNRRLSSLDADLVTATISTGAWDHPDADWQRIASEDSLVASIGTFTILNSNLPAIETAGGEAAQLPIVVATPAGLAARGASITEGQLPDVELSQQQSSTVVVGQTAARDLGVTVGSSPGEVIINHQKFTIVALVVDNASQSLLSTSVVISPSSARLLGLLPPTQDLAVNIVRGSGDYVSDYLPLALAPDAPDAVTVSLPPNAGRIRLEVSTATQTLVAIVSLATFLTSCLGIGITMEMAVRERRGEIGIYRAMGMTRFQTGAKFLVESILLAAFGSIAGWVVGTLISTAVARLSGWQSVMPPYVWALPIAGLAIGVIGGVVPAIRAARQDPHLLLRE